MKLTRLILGLAACAGLCACTNDEPAASAPAQETFDGDALYMVVKISDVGTSTRATDGGYENGSSTEYAVNDAYFYFYDDQGVYVSQAEVWDGGTATEPNQNIEFNGNTVIVLKGLTTNTYPNYMVTVLNRPDGFTPGETLTEMQTKLADESGVGIMKGTNTLFTMSTSSYDNDLVAPFVNELTTANFSLEPIADDLSTITPVEVYVERLAAKVELLIDEDLAATAVEIGNKTGYKLTETIAGDGNQESSGSGQGDEDVYIVINGWGLNGTAKHSNIVKEIDLTWTSTVLGFDWLATSDHRSFWGKSFNYGLGFGQYPTTSGGATDGTTVNEWLDYTTWNALTLALGASTYCAENTNTAGGTTTGGVLQTKNSSAITNVLVAATVCDADGNALDLVRYQGELFTEKGYLDYVMSYLTALGELDIYTLTSTDAAGNNTYTHIDGSYIELAKTDGITSLTDGYVVVIPVADAFTGTFYTKDGEEIAAADAYATVLAQLQAFNADHTQVNAFTGGDMYYSIPIEHLNNTVSTVTDDNGNVIPLEANYGIVRNHCYRLTITSIENLGKGVYDPGEVIIPNINDEQYYYVAANIHILSWKIVSQSVTL